MNSSANEGRTISVSRFLNWVLFPSHSALTMLAASLPCVILYFRLRALIPPELQVEARHIAFGNAYTVIAVIALSLGSNFLVAMIIEMMVTRPLEILARWAAERHARGEGPRFRLVSWITEIRNLGDVFSQLFDEQLCRVKELRVLVGSTRHDISNHLADIYSIAQFLRDDPDYDRHTAAVKTLGEVKTVEHIMDASAEITENYCNIRGAEPTDIRLYDLVNDRLDELQPKATRAGLKLTFDLPPPELVVVAHAALLERIINNLVGNSIKYTPRGGQIHLAVRELPDAPSRPDAKASAPSQIEITVADTGMGIPDADKPHVFEREYRAENARGIAGTGYGLASVHSSVTSYKGTVEISDNKPQGTIFTIRLPLPKPSDQSADIAPASPKRSRCKWPPLLPKSDHWAVYAILVSIPLSGIFSAILFYEIFGSNSPLADGTLTASYYVGGYCSAVILTKITWLFLTHRAKYALSRIGIFLLSLAANAVLYLAYFALRFFVWC